MANTDQTPEARSAQGQGAYVLGAVLPAVIINPAASKSDLLYWARAELGCLGQWLEIACAAGDCSGAEISSMVADRLGPVLNGIDAALERGGAEPWQAP